MVYGRAIVTLKHNKCHIITYFANVMPYITVCIFCSNLHVPEHHKLKCENTVVRECVYFIPLLISSKRPDKRGRVD